MKQYLDLSKRIIKEGTWIENKRTKQRCLTVINADLEFDVGNNVFPLITTRKSFYKSAIAELLCYIRGYDNAEDFRALGTKTWDANANLNDAWLNNPNRKGTDDMGIVYGAVGNNWPKLDNNLNQYNSRRGVDCPLEQVDSIDLLDKCYQNLKNGIDDRGEIWTFWNPGMFDLGCLRPCMHTHTFSLLGDTLHLTSYQRSCDVPLGLNFNQVQVFTLLALMAQITGHKAGTAYHKIVNAHIYENQLDLMENVQVKREPFTSPKLIINPKIKTLEDLRTWVTLDDFEVQDYKHHDSIKYPFSV